MKYRKTIDAEELCGMINKKAAELMGSAAISDHNKADALMDLLNEIRDMPGAEKWEDISKEPPEETLLLIRIEYEGTETRPGGRAVGTGTYHKERDGQAIWKTTSGRMIKWPITGWQLMPSA